jgi:hypothetical protein
LDYDDLYKERISECEVSTANQTTNCTLDQTANNLMFLLRDEKDLRNKSKKSINCESSFNFDFSIENLLKDVGSQMNNLPTHYKKIVQSFLALEKAINDFKFIYKTKSPSIEELERTIGGSLISLKNFRKILYIAPHFYVIKWHKDTPMSSSKLIIDIPVDHEEREKVLNFINLGSFR